MNDLQDTTLGLYGYCLPVGIEVGNPPSLNKDFAFKPFRLIEERLIEQELKTRKAGNHPAQAVLTTLKIMLTKFGGIDFTTATEKEKMSVLSSAPMTDVLYAYLTLRVEALGEELEAPCTCPQCSTSWRWSADLNDLDLTVCEVPPEVVVELRSPIQVGDKEVTKITLGPPSWNALLSLKAGGGDSELKRNILMSSVRRIEIDGNWEARPIPPRSFELLTKRDSERLISVIDRQFPSVDLSISTECPSCSFEGVETITWSHSFIFSSSSLPTERKN